jgi:hypothetical protein
MESLILRGEKHILGESTETCGEDMEECGDLPEAGEKMSSEVGWSSLCTIRTFDEVDGVPATIVEASELSHLEVVLLLPER